MLFQLKKIEFAYAGGEKMTFPDMEFNTGEEWLILGNSGCGKTTLLHMMCGLLKPSSGQITLNGTNIPNLSRNKMDIFRGKNIGIVFQESHMLSSIDLTSNLLAAQSFAGNKKDRKHAEYLLERVGLGHRKKARPSQLSVGERQRAGIARAVINKPAVILADEPTSALDDQNTNEVLSLLREQSEQNNATLIVVTHDSRLKDQIKNRIEL